MPRTRSIRPGFFTNEELAEIGPLGQLLFAGLWPIADREGRLEDRPKRIKLSALPYYDCDVEALLSKLADKGFIIRYSVDGQGYIQVTNWARHQQPNVKEVASTIPAPFQHGANTVLAPELHHTSTEVASLELELESLTSIVNSKDTSSVKKESSKPTVSLSATDSGDNFTLFADAIWQSWPARNGKKLHKAEAYAALKRIPARDWDSVTVAVKNYATSSGAQRGYARDLFRWLKAKEWQDWQQPEVVPSKNGAGEYVDPNRPDEGYSWDRDEQGRWISLAGNEHGYPYGASDPLEVNRIHREREAEYKRQVREGAL